MIIWMRYNFTIIYLPSFPLCPRVLAGAGSRGRGGARPRPTIGSERRSGVQESAESSLQSASATSPHHTLVTMEPDKLGFRIVL